MEVDNENEGFELPIDSFDFIELERMSHSREEEEYVRREEKKREGPISTYVEIKNCSTPKCVNQVYSFEEGSSMCKGNRKQRNSNLAWSVSEEIVLSEEFSESKYNAIYTKFKNPRTNYEFHREYGINEYKTFTDDDSCEEEECSNENRKCKLDFLIVEKMAAPKVKELIFRSNFEGGNLEKVYIKKIEKKGNQSEILTNDSMLKNLESCFSFESLPSSTTSKWSNGSMSQSVIAQKEYFLMVSNDTNTVGFNQWFYFKVYNPNMREIVSNFVIVNLSKKTISNIEEIGINYFSVGNYDRCGVGWKKLYDGILTNYKNNLKKDAEQYYHTLQFEVTIHPEDTVYFSLAIPYTFSKLEELVHRHREHFGIIGTTFCGNPLYVYKTGNPNANKSVVIMGRQHPSETSSSFVVEGVINRIAKSSPLPSMLKKKYQIYVIPMVNPDGVIHGNSRTNLLGYDVNRKWEINPNKKHSFEVFCLMTELMNKIPQIEYLIDLHGHSKKLNSFAYFSTKKTIASIIGLEMAEKLPWFKTSNCQLTAFAPMNTLREFSVNTLKVSKALTIETSIYGWSDENNNIHAFTPQEMSMIGSVLIDGICRVEIQRSSGLRTMCNIQFAEYHESSDSDPEGDYLMERKELEKNALVENPELNNYPINESPFNSIKKLCSKTASSQFYKHLRHSRERMKTQYVIQNLNVEVPPSVCRTFYRTVSPRQKGELRYQRSVERNKNSKKKLRIKIDGNQTTCKSFYSYTDYFYTTGISGKVKKNIKKNIEREIHNKQVVAMERPKVVTTIKESQHIELINREKLKVKLRYNFSNLLKRNS